MKKLFLILMITFLTSSVLAADSQTVVMNTKTISTITQPANGLKNARRIASKPPNKKPKLKEHGLVKFVAGRINLLSCF